MEKEKKKEDIYLHVCCIKIGQNILFNVREPKKKKKKLRGKMCTHDVNVSVMVPLISLSSHWISCINLDSLANMKKMLSVVLLLGSSLYPGLYWISKNFSY